MDKTGNEIPVEYIEQFIRDDKYNAIYYCRKWYTPGNSRKWKGCNPEDIVFKVLEAILEGKRKCYLKSYSHFKNSVYFALKSELLNVLGIRKNCPVNKDSIVNYILPNLNEDGQLDKLYYNDEATVINEIECKILRERIESIFDKETEKDELMVLEEIFAGGKRGEIAKSLKIGEEKVTNIQKRIVRKIRGKFRENFFEGIEIWQKEMILKILLGFTSILSF